MGEVITFTSGKGGVGKTTTTANVGVGLSLLDKKVVLVDTDIGLRNLDVVMGLENRILYNLVDVLTGRCRVRQALIRDKRYQNLWIIPSSCSNESKNALSKKQMKLLLDDLRAEFDYILIDSPAGIDEGFSLATADADHVVVVTTPQIASIHDADCVLQLLERQKVKRVNILVNCFRKQMVRDGNMLDLPDICELLGAELLGVVLEDEEIIISQNHGESVMGRHTISEGCYRNIARRLCGEELEIPDYIRHRGIFSRIFLGSSARKLV
ncbi:MAG: septum site-determining protein MinD [Roseburia sp.]